MSTNTEHYNLCKPELTDPADITALNKNWDIIDQELTKTGKIATAISSDGYGYTATIDGITELYAGLKITIIPNIVSATQSPVLTLNGIGPKAIIMPIDGINTSVTTNAAKLPTWLGANIPVELLYDGTRWRAGIKAQSAQYMYGIVPITGGGTGAATVQQAQTNLGIIVPEYGTWTPKWVTSSNTEVSNTTKNFIGQYYKLGKLVYINIIFRGVIHETDIYAYITLPFEASRGDNRYQMTMGSDTIHSQRPTHATVANFGTIDSSGVETTYSLLDFSESGFTTETGDLELSGCYIAEE